MSSFKDRIQFHVFKWFKPLMVGRFKTVSGVKLNKTRISNTTSIGSPENFKVEDNVFIGHFNFIDASNGVCIEKGCQITNYVSIITHSSHVAIRLYGDQYTQVPESEKKVYFRGSVYIGKYTFVGPHSIIMPGSKIGKGSIVSAFSYVNGEFDDFSILAGNPAKVVGDTRKLDEQYLSQHPELKNFYDKWSK